MNAKRQKTSANLFLTLIFSGACFLSACKSRDGGSSPAELDGTWVSTCRSKTDQLGIQYFEVNSLAFSGSTMTSSVRSFSDSGCKTALNDKPLLTGVSNFTTGDFIPGAAGARKFDSQMFSLTITLTTDAFINLYNGNSRSPAICGGGFVKNQPKELTFVNCASTDSVKGEFAKKHDIFKIADKILYFGVMGASGSATDGSTDTARPVALDASFYTKI